MLAGMTAGALAGTGLVVLQEASDALSATDYYSSGAPCAAPSQAAQLAIRSLLDTPPYTNQRSAYIDQGGPEADIPALIGKQYGVNIQGPSKNSRVASPFEQVRESAGNFGITVTLADGDTAKAPSEEDLNSEAGKETLNAINSDLRELPAEFFAMGGVSRIVLFIEGPQSNGRPRGGFAPKEELDTVYQNLHTKQSSLKHEVTHRIDEKFCGITSTENDPVYKSISGNIYEKNVLNSPLTYQAYKRTVTKVLGQRSKIEGKDAFTSCDLEPYTGNAKSKVHVVRDYSLEDIDEDKATLGERLATPPEYGNLFDLQTPLAEKAVLQAARWYTVEPDVVRYFMSQGSRPVDCTD